MIVSLVTLVVLLIGAAAMIRSMNSSLSAAGSYGFKRDMANQGVRALAYVRDTLLVSGGALFAETSRENSNVAENYSATMLATSPEGIPNVLLGNDAAFASAGSAGKDISIDDMQVKVRYVIDRMCTAGTTVPTASNCMIASAPPPTGGSGGNGKPKVNPPTPQAIYRLTVRVTGPRNAQSFFQSTFTV